MKTPSTQREQFDRLLQLIRTEVHQLKKRNRDLQRENLRLKSNLEKLQKGENDIFSVVSNQERIVMKNQIDRMIQRIDHYLEE